MIAVHQERIRRGEEWARQLRQRLDQLLKHEHPAVRSEVAWAVQDAARPKNALEMLISTGTQDAATGVRYWALRALQESSRISLHEKLRIVHSVLIDPDEAVRSLAERIEKELASET